MGRCTPYDSRLNGAPYLAAIVVAEGLPSVEDGSVSHSSSILPRMIRRSAFAVVLVAGAGHISAQGMVDLSQLGRDGWRFVNRTPALVTEDERPILRFDERAGGGLAWSPGLRLTDGDIEVDVRGRNVLQKSFIGVAFHIAADTAYEVVWLRPFNYESSDSARRAHAVQYADYPDYSWQVLREQRPGAFEAAVPADVKPDAWLHLRVELRGAHVRVFLNRATTPILAVEAPGGRTTGGVGLWVGDNSPGDFANLRVRPLPGR